MKRCPDPDCRHRREHGRPAEYREDIDTCPECGAHLLEEQEPPVTEPQPASPVPVRLWTRLAVTVAVPIAVLFVERIPLPGVSVDVLEQLARIGGDLSQLSILALGLVPIIAAYSLVELAALVVPPWRWMRISGPFGRRRLEMAVGVVAAILALAQGYSVATWVEHQILVGVPMSNPGLAGRLAMTVTLAAGTMVLWASTRLIGRFGIGNGFSVLMAALTLPSVLAFFVELWMIYRAQAITPVALLLSWSAVVAIVGLAWWALRRPESGLRTPSCGLTPIEWSAAVLMVPATLGTLFDVSFEWLYPHSVTYLLLQLLLVVVAGLGFAVLYNRPARMVAAWRPFGEEGLETRARRWLQDAILPSLAPLVLMVLAYAALMRSSAATFQLSLVLAFVVVAVAWDVVDEWRARRAGGELVAVWPVHRVYAVDAAIRYLRRHDIAAFARAVRHRTLLQFFGPFVPMELLVPEAQAERAFELMRDAHGPGR